MSGEFEIEKERLSHAYLFAGDFEHSLKAVLEISAYLLSVKEEDLSGHPDFFHEKFESMGIGDSHYIISRSSMRPFLGDKKVFIIETTAITMESANALLKVVEEPPEGTYFFLLAPSVQIVIPTLRSRLVVVDQSRELPEIEEKEFAKAEEFMSMPIPKRLEQTRKMGEEGKEEISSFINKLEVVVRRKALKAPKEFFGALEEIERSKKFIYYPASSGKIIMDHLALTLPEM